MVKEGETVYFFKIRRKWVIRSVITLLIVTITIFWALRYPESVKNLSRIFPSFSLPEKKHWTLEVHTTFSRCGHAQDARWEYTSQKEADRVLEANPKYQVDSRRSYRIICREQRAGWCVSCDENRFLGIENHHVAIIRGTPAKPGPVMELTPIGIELLPAVEREDLKAGIPFRDEKEKLQLLEGLNGLSVN